MVVTWLSLTVSQKMRDNFLQRGPFKLRVPNRRMSQLGRLTMPGISVCRPSTSLVKKLDSGRGNRKKKKKRTSLRSWGKAKHTAGAKMVSMDALSSNVVNARISSMKPAGWWTNPGSPLGKWKDKTLLGTRTPVTTAITAARVPLRCPSSRLGLRGRQRRGRSRRRQWWYLPEKVSWYMWYRFSYLTEVY